MYTIHLDIQRQRERKTKKEEERSTVWRWLRGAPRRIPAPPDASPQPKAQLPSPQRIISRQSTEPFRTPITKKKERASLLEGGSGVRRIRSREKRAEMAARRAVSPARYAGKEEEEEPPASVASREDEDAEEEEDEQEEASCASAAILARMGLVR